MTREEALKIIKRWLLNGTAGLTKDKLGYIEEWFHKEDAEAFEMAIKALEEQGLNTWNEENMETKEKCPICEYEFEDCQCPFGGTCHPDRGKRARVVADHIYLFTDKQIEHLKKIQKWWSISYDDEEKNQILKELESEV